ncbi:/Sialidase superfamily/BNR/Asp-box repeat protein [Golovinomyces cichoracearum]|uniref:/Sialidase superfamily/BNR/Asp-box repeat protein n=1 Tax=Golovinomyces cichoracearum TaxID=62708 RepID=A0A420J8G4_9PEZI|nr:/Sialidase superfamily/BNR/Asp-box repeat protein [Golovinomyces cichoracearum]
MLRHHSSHLVEQLILLFTLITSTVSIPARKMMVTQSGADNQFSVTGTNAAYPRANYLANGQILGVYTDFPEDSQVLTLVTSSDNGNSWSLTGTAARKAVKDGMLDNGYVLQIPSGRVLLAFRNHDRDASGRITVFRITVCRSDDNGASWTFHSDAVVVNATPENNGVWEPFLRNAHDGSLQLYFSRERSALDQDSVMLSSRDGGSTWHDEKLISGQVESRSRDGMVGITEISRGQLVAVFETNENGGPFFLETVSSWDDGASWGSRKTLYRSPPGKNAGAPQIALVGNTLLVSFMTDEDNNIGNAASWIDVADSKLLISKDGGGTWSKSTVFQEPSFWPGLTVLNSGNGFLYIAGSNGIKSRKFTL